MLGFIKSNSAEFKDPYTIISLYNSLVRPHLVVHFNDNVVRSNLSCSETLIHCTFLCNTVINNIDIFYESSRQSFKNNLVMILNQLR